MTTVTQNPSFATVGALLLARNVLGNVDMDQVLIFDKNDSSTFIENEIAYEGTFSFGVVLADHGKENALDAEVMRFGVEVNEAVDTLLLYTIDNKTDEYVLETEVSLLSTDDKPWDVNLENEFACILHNKGIRPLNSKVEFTQMVPSEG